MTNKLRKEFIHAFHSAIVDSSNSNGEKLIDWIDKNFISRQELVEEVGQTRHKNCGCCSEQVWDEFLSFINPPISKE